MQFRTATVKELVQRKASGTRGLVEDFSYQDVK